MKSGLMDDQIAVMAGFVEGVLAAYVTGVAVDDKVIIEAMVIREELKSSNIGSLTLYAFMQACRRTQGVSDIVNSREFANDPGLTRYKESMGFAVQLIPVTVKVRSVFEVALKTFVRYRRPQLYFRLYGHY